MNAIPAAAHPPLGVRDYVSVAIFATSWVFEIGEWAEDSTSDVFAKSGAAPVRHVPALPIVWSTELAPYAYITLIVRYEPYLMRVI